MIESRSTMEHPHVVSHTLVELLDGLAAPAFPVPPIAVRGLAYRSDTVAPGTVFFCVRGLVFDGHDFAADAVSRGAVALVVGHTLSGIDVPQILVDDPRRALAVAAARFWGDPSGKLDVVGITGTNGKTTAAHLTASITALAGRETGLIGTVETRIGTEIRPASRTTPESADLQALLAEMVEAGAKTAVMEVSSHAIDLHRVDAVHFAVAAFTNLSQDHLDYHGTLERYFEAKTRLFTELAPAASVINIDDAAGASLVSSLSTIGRVITVGRAAAADVRATGERPGRVSTVFCLVTPDATVDVELPLPGAFNVSNALVAAGCALALGIEPATIAEGLTRAGQVPGRLERVEAGQPFAVLVDYAHTPDGLIKAIEAVRAVTSGRVITVFGCGGDRDHGKRSLMGQAAGRLSDLVIATSDNPRSEDPDAILSSVEEGLRRAQATYEIQPDRRAAIVRALDAASPGDAVLIAGKGHETYQTFADGPIHFDDREVAREELEAKWTS